MASVVNRETYKIMSSMKNFSLDVRGGSSSNNVPVIAYKYGGGNNQKWVAASESDGSFTFTSRSQPNGGSRFVMDASMSAIGTVIVYEYSGADNQQWIAEQIAADSYLCFIKSKKLGTYLQFNGDGQSVSLVAKNPSEKNQQWSFQELSGGICVDGPWLDSLVWPKKAEQAQKRQEEEKEREKKKYEITEIEIERFEKIRIEHEKLERQKAEQELLQQQLLIKERELAIRELELKIKLQDAAEAAKSRAEKALVERENALTQRERELLEQQLARKAKMLKEREVWTVEYEKFEVEWKTRQPILTAQNKLVELEALRTKKTEFDRRWREILESEKFLRSEEEAITTQKAAKDKELAALALVDRELTITKREEWLNELEARLKRKIVIKYHTTTTSTVPASSGHTHTTTTEVFGDEKVTTTKDVIITEKKTVHTYYE